MRQALVGRPPRHVQQFLEEGHLRWDSLGEFCALVASFEHFGQVFKNDRAKLLAETLDQAIGEHLEKQSGPIAPGERTGHPRQSFLPRSVLGANAGQADPRSRAASSLYRGGPAVGRQRRQDCAGAERRSGDSRWISVVITIPMMSWLPMPCAPAPL